jgi:hypothetical protein
LPTDDAYNRCGRLRILSLNASFFLIRTAMKHSTLRIAHLPVLAVALICCAPAYATSGDGTAHAETSSANASPALAASSATNDSGLATEDASRANEQQLLGLPRVPKDTNLSASDDDDATSVKHVALRRSPSKTVASATKRAEVFPEPFSTSIYRNGTNGTVYKNPW